METLINILSMILFTIAMAEDERELKIMKEMIMETNNRVLLTEKTLKKTQDELQSTRNELAVALSNLSFTKKDLKTALVKLAISKNYFANSLNNIATKKDLAATREDLIITITDLATKDDHLMTKTKDLEREVAYLKDSPFLHVCGSYYNGLYIRLQTIPYSSLLYSATNTEGGGLDLETGIFTSPFPGSYSVTWSLLAAVGTGEFAVTIYLRRNGEIVEESRHLSSYTGADGYVYDQGGRTLVLYLGLGDTLSLYCGDCSAGIFYTTFCVSLATVNTGPR